MPLDLEGESQHTEKGNHIFFHGFFEHPPSKQYPPPRGPNLSVVY